MKITISIYKYLSDYNLGCLIRFFSLSFFCSFSWLLLLNLLRRLCCMSQSGWVPSEKPQRITGECGEIEENNKIKKPKNPQHSLSGAMLHKRLLDASKWLSHCEPLLGIETINTHSSLPQSDATRMKNTTKLNLQATICAFGLAICLLSKMREKIVKVKRKKYDVEKKSVSDI